MLKSIKVEIKKSLLNKYYWLSVGLVFFIMFFNLLDEMRLVEGSDCCSVLYFWMYRHGLGGISVLLIFLCAIPNAIQFNFERNSGVIKEYVLREGKGKYFLTKIICTWILTVSAFVMGYLLLLMVLEMKYPLLPGEPEITDQIIMEAPFVSIMKDKFELFAILNIVPEICVYGMLSIVALIVSVFSQNTYIIISSPVIMYYLWNYLSGLLQLPKIMCWTLQLNRGFRLLKNDYSNLLFNFLYFIFLSVICGAYYYFKGVREIENV